MAYLFSSSVSKAPSGKDETKSVVVMPPMVTAVALSAMSVAIPGHYKSAKAPAVRKKKGKNSRPESAVWTMERGIPFMNRRGIDGNQVYRLTSQYETTFVHTTSTTLETFSQVYVTLTNFSNASALGTLFDQYRIAEIEVWYIPQSKVETTTAAQQVGLMFTVVDYDDTTSLASVNAATEYDSCISSPGDSGHYRRFTPHIAVAAYSGAFTSYANETAPWIDVASNGVYHFGVKCAHSTTSVVYSYNTVVRAAIELRNVR